MTPKYFGEQNESVHGSRLVWPGGPSGLPGLASALPGGPLRDRQYWRSEVIYTFRAAEFRTWVPEDVRAYQEVMDRCANQSFRLRQQLTHYDEAKGGWVFWVEWLQQYEVPAPPEKRGQEGAFHGRRDYPAR